MPSLPIPPFSGHQAWWVNRAALNRLSRAAPRTDPFLPPRRNRAYSERLALHSLAPVRNFFPHFFFPSLLPRIWLHSKWRTLFVPKICQTPVFIFSPFRPAIGRPLADVPQTLQFYSRLPPLLQLCRVSATVPYPRQA